MRELLNKLNLLIFGNRITVINDNEIIVSADTYVAIESEHADSCKGCAFNVKGSMNCVHLKGDAPCGDWERNDGLNVIWVKK
jgi:hypothetical protein